MKQRLNNLAENYLQAAIGQLGTEMTQFKNAQQTSGHSGVKGYLVQSANTWDLTGTIGTDADTSTITSTFSITYAGDGSQSPVMANLSFYLYVNGTDTAHQLTPQNNSWTDGTRNANITYNALSQTGRTTYQQTFSLMTTKAITYYIKVVAVASSPGTVGAAKTS